MKTQFKRFLVALLLIVTLPFIWIACNPVNPPSNPSNPSTPKNTETLEWEGTMFFNHPDNPFLKEIPVDAMVHQYSDTMIHLIKQSCLINGQPTNVRVGTGDYGSAIYFADKGTEKKKVYKKVTVGSLTGIGKEYMNVPIPSGAKPARGSDAHLSIVDKDAGCAYLFWIYTDKGGTYFDENLSNDKRSAQSGNTIFTNSSGIFEDGRATVAAGWCTLSAIVWPKELREGRINHALNFSVKVTNGNGHVPPATHHDGALKDNPFAIPEGTLIRIKPSVNIDAIQGLTYVEKVIFKAIQKYGMYCNDTNGAGLSIGGVASSCLPNKEKEYESYDGYTKLEMASGGGNIYLKNLPWESLEVIYTGDLIPNNPNFTVTSGCEPPLGS
ncbi:MAG: hypothetical protein M9887_04800 [Chitinophagales bacterium]|nr:hypothetical protein [Chitinophagales bacterium]